MWGCHSGADMLSRATAPPRIKQPDGARYRSRPLHDAKLLCLGCRAPEPHLDPDVSRNLIVSLSAAAVPRMPP